MKSIDFDANALVKNLDILARIQLPFVAAVTVNRLAGVVKKELRKEMLDSFKAPSVYTLNSLATYHFATKAEPWTVVEHKEDGGKGNAAASYLRPQITGGTVFSTRFQRRLNYELQDYNGSYMLPFADSSAAKKNGQGRVKSSQYVEALYGIKSMESFRASVKPGRYRTEGSYAYVPLVKWTTTTGQAALAKRMRALGRGRLLNPGIYRMMGSKPVQLFKQLDSKPSVQKTYDFAYTASWAMERNAQVEFNKAFASAVGRSNG